MINQWQKKRRGVVWVGGGVGCGWGGWGYNIPKSNTVSLYMPKFTWTHRYLSAAQLRTHARAHTHTHTQTHTHSHAHTYARTHARTHAHTHTHKLTHTHGFPLTQKCASLAH